MDVPIRVLSFNAFVRPPMPYGYRDLKAERMRVFAEAALADYDVILVQELFELCCTHKHVLIQRAFDAGLVYRHYSSPPFASRHLVDSGLLILSRFPITAADSLTFSDGTGIDKFVAKGALYARLQLGMRPSEAVHVFDIHTNAGGTPEQTATRLGQIREAAAFVRSAVREGPAGVPVVWGGDFNVDSRNDHMQAAEEGRRARPVNGTRESDEMMAIVAAAVPEYEFVDVLLEHSEGGRHPVTQAFGHAQIDIAEGTPDPDSAMRVDYVFVGQPPRPEHRLSCPAARVERFRVAGHRGFTQLSDHYAIAATLEFAGVDAATSGWNPGVEPFASFVRRQFPPARDGVELDVLWQLKIILGAALVPAVVAFALIFGSWMLVGALHVLAAVVWVVVKRFAMAGLWVSSHKA